MNCYFLVSKIAFSLHCFPKMLLEKSENQVLGNIKVSDHFSYLREQGHTKALGAWRRRKTH